MTPLSGYSLLEKCTEAGKTWQKKLIQTTHAKEFVCVPGPDAAKKS
jgi:hypothetical protein